MLTIDMEKGDLYERGAKQQKAVVLIGSGADASVAAAIAAIKDHSQDLIVVERGIADEGRFPIQNHQEYQLPPDPIVRKGSWKRITRGSNYTAPKKKRKKRSR